ncbi:MAG: nicotinate-nucleotide adenylyltransferase [Chloroflexota bacterium]
MRVGILGGTFDPVHYGHLLAAQECCYRLRLEKALLVPAAQPPHKLAGQVSPAEHRLAMLRLAVADNPLLEVSTLEFERRGPSYTVHTVAAVRERLGKAAELYFIVGTDALPELLSWYLPRRILELCVLAAVSRPGYPFDLSHLALALPNAAERIVHVPAPELEISSSALRARVANNEPIRYLLPDAVERYIREKGLYSEA